MLMLRRRKPRVLGVLGRDIVDMFISAQIMGYLDTEVLDNIYMLQLVAVMLITSAFLTVHHSSQFSYFLILTQSPFIC